MPELLLQAAGRLGLSPENTSVGSAIYANRPGDGSAREQAASCQRVLGGFANFCIDYATKRYRSNCINWGIVPFTLDPKDADRLQVGDWICVPDLRAGILAGKESLKALVLSDGQIRPLTVHIPALTSEERRILTDGCLMNYYAAQNA